MISLSLSKSKIKLFLLLLLTGANLLGVNCAKASELVVLKYRFLRESISVPELSTFAETGELSTSLSAYLKMAETEPDDLQQALTTPVPVEPIMLSKILNSLPGEILLDRFSEVISTPTRTASRQSLRAALVSSALPDGNIKLIEVLENYPTAEVHVQGDRLAEIHKKMERVLGGLPEL